MSVRRRGGNAAVEYRKMPSTLISTLLLSIELSPRLSTNDQSTQSILPHKRNPPHMSTPPPLHSFFKVPAPRCAAPMRKLRTSANAAATTNNDDQIAAKLPTLQFFWSSGVSSMVEIRVLSVHSSTGRWGGNAPVGNLDSQQGRRSERQSQVPIQARLCASGLSRMGAEGGRLWWMPATRLNPRSTKGKMDDRR